MFSLKALTIGFSGLFFILSLATLPHYGVNWDAISHLSRGQAYLHYYLTGERDYSTLQDWNLYREKEENIKKDTTKDMIPRQRLYFQKPDTIFFNPDLPRSDIPRISIYQNSDRDFNYIVKHYDYGHPHISDVLSSVFNFIFFQKLGLLNDIDSYRIYGILLSSLLVGLVFWWTSVSYGKFAGVIAVLSLSLYPLFLSESHFNNEKDIPETVFWSFTLFSTWRGIATKSWRWILASGVFFGLALGTKFNVLFSIFVILPWLLFYLINNRRRKLSFGLSPKGNTRLLLAMIAVPLLGLYIVIGTWPEFWSDPTGKIARIVGFYKTIGIAGDVDQRFLGPLGVNTYAVQWILYTTPLVILFLAFMGIVVTVSKGFPGKQMQSLFFLLWLMVPIVRVTWPGMNIYGGARQIMEYIPAMAIIAGAGGGWFRDQISGFLRILGVGRYKQTLLASFLVIGLFFPITLKLIKIHPNENVYFNPIIGGLAGAKGRDFPGWGVSFGAPYRGAIEWINSNAEPGAKLTLGSEILSNLPGMFIRADIEYKSNRSGYLRQGEYVISLRFHGTDKRSYFDMYLDRMVNPLYEITVDGVPILKIWKNSRDYLKPEWRDEVALDSVKFVKNDKGVFFDIGKEVKLSRLELEYNENDCPELVWGYLILSRDNREWERVPGVLPEEVRIKALGNQPSGGKFIEPFAGQNARYINFFVMPTNTCVTQIEKVRLYHF